MTLFIAATGAGFSQDPAFPPWGLVKLFWVVFFVLLITAWRAQKTLDAKEKETPLASGNPKGRIIRALLIALVFFAVLEGALRFGLVFIKDDRSFSRNPAFWTLKPNHSTTRQGIEYRSNHLGLRGSPLKPKEPGEIRVLCMGDSWTIGQGVAEESVYGARLEKLLQKAFPHKKITVINGGMFGYSVLQGYYLLEAVWPSVEPDIVIVGGFNRMANSQLDIYEREMKRQAKRGIAGRIADNLLIYQCIRKTLPPGDKTAVKSPSPEDLRNIYLYYRNRLAHLCGEKNVPLVMFDHISLPLCRRAEIQIQDKTIPLHSVRTPSGNCYFRLSKDPALADGDGFSDKSEETPPENIGFYMLCPGDCKKAGRDFFLVNDVTHPSETGHGVIADLLFKIVSDDVFTRLR